jgi:hypothetical protein
MVKKLTSEPLVPSLAAFAETGPTEAVKGLHGRAVCLPEGVQTERREAENRSRVAETEGGSGP